MKYSHLVGKTARQKLPGSEVISHQLLLRGGFITPVAAGIYSYLPLGYRVLSKIDAIIRSVFNANGIQEVVMPMVHPATLWQETGRFTKMRPILAVFEAGHGGDYLIAPTHEETVTDIARKFIRSHKDLPVILNQNQWKYRDEVRVNGGLLRTREFLMQDAYSFDADEDGLSKSFTLVSGAYHEIFEKIGLPVVVVKADSGAIGGTGSEEFMVLSQNGEDRIFTCDACEYKANIEKAESKFPAFVQDEKPAPIKEVEGKGIIGVEQLAEYLDIPVQKTTKTLLYQADDQVVAVCVRGEYSVSEVKLANILGCLNLSLASAGTVKRLTGAEVGYAGPLSLPKDVRVIWDKTTAGRVNFECGANRTDFHTVNVNFGRDISEPDTFYDIREVKAGETCPVCGKGKLIEARTIELGHVFKLGTVYSDVMNAKYLDQDGKTKPIVMGCYGIGISRAMAAVVEVSHDDRGIIWPEAVAPFTAHLVSIGETEKNASDVYHRLTEAGIDVLWDDRDVSAGVKFSDADLIGIPYRLVVSPKTGDKVEIKQRTEKETNFMTPDEITAFLTATS